MNLNESVSRIQKIVLNKKPKHSSISIDEDPLEFIINPKIYNQTQVV